MILSRLCNENVAAMLPIMDNGNTKCHFKVRICGYLGIAHPTGKTVKIDKNRQKAIQKRLLCCNQAQYYEELLILTRESIELNPLHASVAII